MIDRSAITDQIVATACYGRSLDDATAVRGWLHVQLIGPDGEIKYDRSINNLVTQTGDQYYGERAAGVASPPAAVTGMQLGTGVTAPAKTGAAAAVGTLVATSLVALTGTPTSSLSSGARRISYAASWAAGVATANNISEVVLVNQATGTQTAAPASATIARGLLSPVVNKAAGDTLAVTWNHDLSGA